MEKLTEQRVREIIREEVGRNMVTLSPTVVVKTGADMDETIKKIADHLEEQFASTAKGVYVDEELAPESQKRTGLKLSEVDVKTMQEIAKKPSSVPFLKEAFEREELTLEQKIETIVETLRGLKSYEWSRIQQHIDMMYSSQAAKVEIDDLKLLKENIIRDFNF
ncbi:hypothetical protein UY416_09530 [Paenibacillus polymyxa]|uniref:hypothetical protein n=1 Tax=Paenibacillus polymyxa TaxID=1406 RepID=UPI002AB5B30C|nr:hypothetical protein [Paenibacillus polymyxa]MDY8046533.1 hypothetical protein [Paenibacillus polymyxa]